MNTRSSSLRSSWSRIFVCTAVGVDWRNSVLDDEDAVADQIRELRSLLTPAERDAEGMRDLCYSIGIRPPHDLVPVELERVLQVVRDRAEAA